MAIPDIIRSGNRGGRPKGSQNQTTKDFKEFWAKFFSDPRYKRNLMRRILTGKATHMELYVCQLLYGKPKEKIEFEGPDGQPLRGVVVYIPENDRGKPVVEQEPIPDGTTLDIVPTEPHGNGNGAGGV